MIHVCRLDIGSRHVFDSADGINDVGSLSQAIEIHFKIPKNKQILLISGGEVLEDYQQKLYRLSAGREESPIYLIDKQNVEREYPPTIEMPLDNLIQDMKTEIESAILLRPSYQTLQARSSLAKRVYELGKNLHKLCQSFYDDQYWQYQGFLALIANLDEFISSFRKRQNIMNEQFEKYLNNKTYYKELTKDIENYIEILANIRFLPQILSQTNQDKLIEWNDCKHENKFNQNSQSDVNLFKSFSTQSITNLPNLQNQPQFNTVQKKEKNLNLKNISSQNECQEPLSPSSASSASPCSTLLEWIKSTDPQNKLDSVIDETKEMLSDFDSNFKWIELQSKIEKLLNQIENNPQMREIEGLTKRLQDLNNFLDMSKKFLTAQNEIVESFNANNERATSLRDESILQDLCKGHERQLELFKSNHSKMIEITRKISKAKLELIRVIHSRLSWVMHIQKQMADHDFQLQIYFKQLRRVNVRLKLIEQLKTAPFVYLLSIKETTRRLNFSRAYKSFANSLISMVTKIQNNEMVKRQEFDNKIALFSQHFVLSILFKGLADKVEPFLNEISFKFDNQLPDLIENDVLQIESELKTQLENLKNKNQSRDSIASSPQLISKESNELDDNKSGERAKNSIELNDDILNEFKLNKINEELNLKNDSDLKLLISINKILNQKENTTNEKLNNSNEFNHQNKKIIDNLITEIKSKLKDSKNFLESYQTELTNTVNTIVEKQKEYETRHLELNKNSDFSLLKKNEFYGNLMSFLEKYLSQEITSTQIDEFTNQLNDKYDKDFSEKLLNLLETYFKTNLKQIDELKSNIKTLKTNLNADKQIQFNEAIKRATQDKDKIIEELRLKEMDYLKQINTLEIKLRAKSDQLTSDSNYENVKNIEPSQSSQGQLSSIIDDDTLKCDFNEIKSSIQGQKEDKNFTKIKLKELMLIDKINQLEKKLASFTTLPVTNDYHTIQLCSCNIDDLVIAVYSEKHASYRIIHNSTNYLHFVHSAIFKSHEQLLSFKSTSNNSTSSNTPTHNNPSISVSNEDQSQFEIHQLPNISNLKVDSSTNTNTNISASGNMSKLTSIDNLAAQDNNSKTESSLVKNSPSDNIHNIFLSEKQPRWFVGRVLVKEFCIARKENNRFRVPSGTRFFRVKLKPYNLY